MGVNSYTESQKWLFFTTKLVVDLYTAKYGRGLETKMLFSHSFLYRITTYRDTKYPDQKLNIPDLFCGILNKQKLASSTGNSDEWQSHEIDGPRARNKLPSEVRCE